ncbi:MAG: TolC family protein, partial [Fibrella sp.]|nr:TolC family protein [Armatimonadota bacterium]
MFRRLKPLLLGGFIPFAVCLPAMGQDAPPVSLSIEEAVGLAVRNSPRLVAARGDARSASFGVSSARALVNPNAFFAPGITSVSGTGEEFLIQQPLEINGVRSARAGIARAGQREAEARSLSTLRETVYAAQVAYYELARAREQVTVAREALTVAREFDRIARRQVEEGVRPGIELAQTGLEISRSQVQFTSAEGREESARAALNTVIGRDTGDAVGKLSPLIPAELPPAETEPGTVAVPPVAPQLPAPSAPVAPAQPSDLSTTTLLGRAVSSRAEIAGGTASAQRFRAEAALARAEGRPDIVPQFRVGY